jgi:DNA-binding transcriptional regulator YdaS (Cro superfamily)
MAERLGLDPTYLSQLENGARPVDPWYIQRAEEIESAFGKAKEVKETAPAGFDSSGVRERAHAYLDRVLDACDADEDKLRWTLVELQRRFPLEVDHPAHSPSSAPQSRTAKTVSALLGEKKNRPS